MIVPKYSRRVDLFNGRILSLYAHGMTKKEIVDHLKQIHNVKISSALVGSVAAAVLEYVKE